MFCTKELHDAERQFTTDERAARRKKRLALTLYVVGVHAPARGEICCVFAKSRTSPLFPAENAPRRDFECYSLLVLLAIYDADVPQTRPQTGPGGFLLFWHPRARDARGEQGNRHSPRRRLRNQLNYLLGHPRGERRFFGGES